MPLQELPGEYAKRVQQECAREGAEAKVVRWGATYTFNKEITVKLVDASTTHHGCCGLCHCRQNDVFYQLHIKDR